MANVQRDENYIPGLLAESSAGDLTQVPLYADPVTHRLLVQSVIGNFSGTSAEGDQVSVGTAQVQLTFSGTTISVMVQADHDNTGSIWVGPSGITTSGDNAFVRLEAGESFTIDLEDGSLALYAISDTADQTVYKVALT